jgi:mono/diheme cytochrome c family protein
MHKLPTIVIVGVLLWACIAYGQASPDGDEFFEKKIRPVLASKCYACHGDKLASSGLRLDFKGGWERGGNRGTAIIPGDPDGSLLIKAISYRDPQLKMPPGGRLSEAEMADLSEWVRTGATDPRAAPPSKPQVQVKLISPRLGNSGLFNQFAATLLQR